MSNTEIKYLTLSQEDLINAGAFDFRLAIEALKKSLFLFKNERILFPDKIVQIFKEETQERINCLPATLLDEKICGVKWVSVFPPNPRRFGVQNLSAIIVLVAVVVVILLSKLGFSAGGLFGMSSGSGSKKGE